MADQKLGPILEKNKRKRSQLINDEPKPKPQATPSPSKPSPSNTVRPTKGKTGGSHRYFKSVTSRATATQANRTVLIGVGGAASIVLLARVAGTPGVKGLNDPGDLIKIAIGTGAVTIALMIGAEIAPDLVIGLSWLILVGALLTYGVDFANALSKGTLNPGQPPKKGK